MSDGTASQFCMRAPSTRPRAGDFPLGSAKSRAAARALIQERNRPTPPPWGTSNLSFLSVDEAREPCAKFSALHGEHILGTPWLPVRWPDGFKPDDPANASKTLIEQIRADYRGTIAENNGRFPSSDGSALKNSCRQTVSS